MLKDFSKNSCSVGVVVVVVVVVFYTNLVQVRFQTREGAEYFTHSSQRHPDQIAYLNCHKPAAIYE